MSYQVQYSIPYEGQTIEYFDTWEEVEAWVEDFNGASYRPYDSYEIYKVEYVGGSLE